MGQIPANNTDDRESVEEGQVCVWGGGESEPGGNAEGRKEDDEEGRHQDEEEQTTNHKGRIHGNPSQLGLCTQHIILSQTNAAFWLHYTTYKCTVVPELFIPFLCTIIIHCFVLQ